MLDERVGKPIQHENCVGRVRKSWKKGLIEIKLSSNTKFPHPTRFSIFSQILRSAKPIQHFIQHGKNAMLDEMLDWFASAFRIIYLYFCWWKSISSICVFSSCKIYLGIYETHCVIWYHLYKLKNVKTPMEECYF